MRCLEKWIIERIIWESLSKQGKNKCIRKPFITHNRGTLSSNYHLTGWYHRLYTSPIDEGSFDGLSANIRPVDAVLQSIIIHHCDIVDVGHSEWDDVVVIGIINVHPSDFNLTSVQQELTVLWTKRKTDNSLSIDIQYYKSSCKTKHICTKSSCTKYNIVYSFHID